MPLYKVSLIIIKNGFSNTIVINPNEIIITATMSGNSARLLRSTNPSISDRVVSETKMVVAVINVVSSEATKKPMIGPNSMNRFMKSFINIFWINENLRGPVSTSFSMLL
jgi:hypothetical protein